MNQHDETDQLLKLFIENLSLPDTAYWEVQSAARFIHQNLCAPEMSAGWVREQCGIIEKSFIVKFDLGTGYPPQRYITHQRIEAAKLLLAGTEETITFISFRIGFHSVSSFDKTFKRKTGMPPSVWRRKKRNGRPEL